MYFYGWMLLNQRTSRDPCTFEDDYTRLTATFRLYDVVCQGELLKIANGETANPMDYKEYYKCWFDIDGEELDSAPVELPVGTPELTEIAEELINAIYSEIAEGPLIFAFTNFIVKGNDDNPDIT